MNFQRPVKVPDVTVKSGINLDNETVAQIITVISMLRDNQMIILERLNQLENLVIKESNPDE